MAIDSVYDLTYPFKNAPFWNDLESTIMDSRKDDLDLTLVDPLAIPSPLYINDLK